MKTHSIARKGDMPYVAKVVWKRGIAANIASFLWVFAGWVDHMMAEWSTICPRDLFKQLRDKKTQVEYSKSNWMTTKRF